MIRWLLWLLAGALLGGIVHLVAVLILPRTATQDAYSRLAPVAPVNAVTAVPQPRPQNELMPFMDPAFASAVCRYDLATGPIKLTVPISPAYTSVSFYTRRGVAYYAINDRSAGRRQIELLLMTAAQRAELPEEEDVTAADRLIVEIAERHRPYRDARAGAGAWDDAGRPDSAQQGRLQAGAVAGGTLRQILRFSLLGGKRRSIDVRLMPETAVPFGPGYLKHATSRGGAGSCWCQSG